ncbi:MAG: class I SAM-dependent DNA methyltransferase [Bacteroidota bacterium]
MSISGVIKSIQDIMWKDVGLDGDAQRISQLGWMLFLKILDDQEKQFELLNSKYKSVIPQKYRWRTWAENPEGLTGEDLIEFVNNELFRRLKELPSNGNPERTYIVRSVFEDTFNYMKSGTLMRQVINKINGAIDFKKSEDRHILGDIYEQILKDLQSAGNAGEYYTPRPITQFMVEMIDPQLGEKVFDPACGTGGFLTCTIEHVRKEYVRTTKQEDKLQKSIYGVEKKPLPHLLCMTNMLLHEVEVPSNILHDNTLAKPFSDYKKEDEVDIVLTNPPFGGMEEDGIAGNFPAAYRTKETADLFLVLITKILKEGGRAAIVLPDGSLTGDGLKLRIRQKLLEECNVHTIVRLPNSVFQPYASVATNLIFFEKGKPTKEIWYYEHRLPETQKAYSKTRPIQLKEFEPIRKWWKKRKESEISWKLNIGQKITEAKKEAKQYWEAAINAQSIIDAHKKRITRIDDDLKGKEEKQPLLEERQRLQSEIGAQEKIVKEQQQNGDSIYGAAFELDIKNPVAQKESVEYTSKEIIEKLNKSFAKSLELIEHIKSEL